MKDVISVDTIAELFWDGYEHQECDDSCPVAGKYNQAKQALHSLLISKLPDKKPLVFEKEYSTPRELLPQEQEIKLNTNHQVIGFNQAVDNMNRVIDEMFGVGG